MPTTIKTVVRIVPVTHFVSRVLFTVVLVIGVAVLCPADGLADPDPVRCDAVADGVRPDGRSTTSSAWWRTPSRHESILNRDLGPRDHGA